MSMNQEPKDVTKLRDRLSKLWEQEQREERDREFAKSFGDAASSQSDLIFRLRLQVGVLQQQIRDERFAAHVVVAVVAIACTILGRLL
ncbi:MAG TPA: hypothetical protein V6C57_23630 [Coleofasciculaceae cyanobacterium]